MTEKTAYDLARKWISLLSDIDTALEKKSKLKDPAAIKRADDEIDNLEVEMLKVKKQMQEIKL